MGMFFAGIGFAVGAVIVGWVIWDACEMFVERCIKKANLAHVGDTARDITRLHERINEVHKEVYALKYPTPSDTPFTQPWTVTYTSNTDPVPKSQKRRKGK